MCTSQFEATLLLCDKFSRDAFVNIVLKYSRILKKLPVYSVAKISKSEMFHFKVSLSFPANHYWYDTMFRCSKFEKINGLFRDHQVFEIKKMRLRSLCRYLCYMLATCRAGKRCQ